MPDERAPCVGICRVLSGTDFPLQGGQVCHLWHVFFAKMHNLFTLQAGNSCVGWVIAAIDNSASRQKNTLVTRRVGQLGHKGSLSTPATSIYIIITIYLFGKGFSPVALFFFGCHPFAFYDIKFAQVPNRKGDTFLGFRHFFRSIAGFFTFRSSFPRVGPCLPLPSHRATVLLLYRYCWVRCSFVSCSWLQCRLPWLSPEAFLL